MSKDAEKKLQEAIPKDAVKSKAGKGFVDHFYAVDEANVIFGNLGWSSEVLECEMVGKPVQFTSSNKKSNWRVIHRCLVRVSVGDVFHDGVGASEMMNPSLGDAIHFSMGAAETQAIKRALMRFGRRMGLALYDDDKVHVTENARPQGEKELGLNVFHFGKYRGHKMEGVSGKVVAGYVKELKEYDEDDVDSEHLKFAVGLLQRLKEARDKAKAAKAKREAETSENLEKSITQRKE